MNKQVGLYNSKSNAIFHEKLLLFLDVSNFGNVFKMTVQRRELLHFQ